MADFHKAIEGILQNEGGYVFDKDDAGGETNHGVTDKLDGKVDGMADIDGDGTGDVLISKLTSEQASQIYKRVFWDEMKGDQIKDQSVASIVFDAFVNSGPVALKQLQKEIGVSTDGKIGPNTLAVLNQYAGVIVFEAFKDARIRFYKALAERKPSQKKFLKGWLNRINAFKYKSLI